MKGHTYTFPTLTGVAVAQQDGVGAMVDDDAIVTDLTTAASEVVLSGGDLDGAIGGADCTPWRGLSVTTDVAVGAYTTGVDIVAVVEIERDGQTSERTITAQLTLADGGETVDFTGEGNLDGAFQRVISITIPAMADTDGTIKFGVGDVYARLGQSGERFSYVMGLADGNVKVGYPGGVDVLATAAGRVHAAEPHKVFRAGTTAAFSVGTM